MPASQAIFPADVDHELTEADFRLVVDLIKREAGIVVREHKQAMVRGRLVRRARELGVPSLRAYCELLKGPELADELPGLLNALTTNHTAFYREEHHFTHMEEVALPAHIGRTARQERFRIWCAAASTGEEPYTIAATLNAYLSKVPHPDALILATDIDSDVLATASRGTYAAETVAKLSDLRRQRLELSPAGEGRVAVSAALKARVRFRQLNILQEWPFAGPFQMIFCRNMLIYFDQPTKQKVVERLTEMLSPGGFLYLGHSEALPGVVKGLQLSGRTVYRRN